MKKSSFPFRLLAVVLLTALLLSGCSAALGRQLREKAESYLSALTKAPGVSDRFTLGETPKLGPKSASADFSVSSETFGKTFTVRVSRDGSEISDDYYSLYLSDEAVRAVQAVYGSAVGDTAFTPAVSFRKGMLSAALSRHAAGSLKELYALSGNAMLLEIDINTAGKANLSEAQIDRLLLALASEGLYCRLYPYISDAVWFEVSADGFWKNTQTGADGGAMLNRVSYTPAAP